MEEKLSGQEIAVLKLLASGASQRDIQTELNIAIPTIKTYTTRLCGKLKARNTNQAITIAFYEGILTPKDCCECVQYCPPLERASIGYGKEKNRSTQKASTKTGKASW